MPDDGRVYSDEEFALILRQASELATRAEPSGTSSGGLTLAEMQAVAAQVGIDPALVERAARMVAVKAAASPLDRLMGGPLRHAEVARFPVRLDADAAARLLSAVRISAVVAGGKDVGHSSPLGITWHDGGEMEALGVTARSDAEGTAVSVTLDRSGTLAFVAMASGITMLLSLLFAGSALYPEDPALGIGGAIAGVGGTLAIARGYWASSTRRARERIRGAMDAIGDTLARPKPEGDAPDGDPR